MASTVAYRPSTSGTHVPVRRPSAVSASSFRSKHSGSTPTSEEMPSLPPKLPDTARSAQFTLNRPRVPMNPDSLSRKRKRKVRPQYPAESEEKHVEYILVASFDIDEGSIMEQQYPAPIGGDEHMLAELMLPDGAHARSQDWTMFFLHKEDEAAEQEQPQRIRGQALNPRARDDGDGEDEHDDRDDESVGSVEDDDLKSVEGPPLVYVLNLVVTKQDNTVRRGAVCKAIAICTRHSFLHIYKPLLLLAIEEYFKAPVPETLAVLYDAVNSMDLSSMPRLSLMERLIIQATDTKDLFLEKFETLIQQKMAAKGEHLPDLYGGDSPTLTRQRYGLPRDTHEFESVIPYKGIPIPVKIPTALTVETVGDFSLIQLIQTFSNPHISTPQPFVTQHPHLTTSGPLTHPIIVLLNALLTQKRIVFIGHNLPSSTVAEAVLAACALASGGFLRGFIRHAFPYTDLTKIDDLLKVPGFIAGVTNPTFSLHDEWWDLLCDLTTGRMKISPKLEPAGITEGVAYFQQGGQGYVPGPGPGADLTGDNAFMGSIMSAINERRGEVTIRARFRLWILKFVRQAAAFEELVYGASALVVSTPVLDSLSPSRSESGSAPFGRFPQSEDPAIKGYGYVWSSPTDKQREMAANATRIEGWTKTRSYYNYIQDLAVFFSYRSVKNIDLQHLHDKLARLRLGADAAGAIYTAICKSVLSDAQISQLLVVAVNTPPNPTTAGGALTSAGAAGTGGLFHIALGLFHPKLEVRERVAELLGRIREHDAGRHFWTKLGGFEKLAWERVESARREKEER